MKRSKFLDGVREVIRTNHFIYGTEKTYINWIYRFIFHNKRHPQEMRGRRYQDPSLTLQLTGRCLRLLKTRR